MQQFAATFATLQTLLRATDGKVRGVQRRGLVDPNYAQNSQKAALDEDKEATPSQVVKSTFSEISVQVSNTGTIVRTPAHFHRQADYLEF